MPNRLEIILTGLEAAEQVHKLVMRGRSEAVKLARTEADPVATLNGARQHAKERGSGRIRARDVAAVTEARKPRELPLSPLEQTAIALLAEMGKQIYRRWMGEAPEPVLKRIELLREQLP